jgi:hypothetical protein
VQEELVGSEGENQIKEVGKTSPTHFSNKKEVYV